ncbi:SCO6745 family protein [Streptomyces aurantiogriseus]|uniref:Uncharacterized protein n=1 Tax=Streptomyces aurantiogriseus TaxID=66870 RepID=A0A918FLU2_9ACTN|nr:hypothetical protein [Streptomyces aurantiogriseus]GGR52742.1 hypothetical protein GCM10010251_82350 [Streptomyces aurantiogriseus]
MKAARAAWRRLEPVHGMIYFVPEARRRYADLGLSGRAGYFTSRSAAFGRASAELVISTFYNFNPDVVRQAVDGAWDATTPQQVLDARYAAACEALRRAGIHELPTLHEVLALTRRAAEAACEHAQGRPLFAAHAALPWPEEPVLQLWHAQTLLREFRGDGHVACLLSEGVGGLEALVLHAATGEVDAEVHHEVGGGRNARRGGLGAAPVARGGRICVTQGGVGEKGQTVGAVLDVPAQEYAFRSGGPRRQVPSSGTRRCCRTRAAPSCWPTT